MQERCLRTSVITSDEQAGFGFMKTGFRFWTDLGLLILFEWIWILLFAFRGRFMQNVLYSYKFFSDLY